MSTKNQTKTKNHNLEVEANTKGAHRLNHLGKGFEGADRED